jgi:hypothetical protein
VKCSDSKTYKSFTILKANSIGISSKIDCTAETADLTAEWIVTFRNLLPKKSKISTAVDFFKEVTSFDAKKEFDFKLFKNEPSTPVFYD